jgi:hypothetical protein
MPVRLATIVINGIWYYAQLPIEFVLAVTMIRSAIDGFRSSAHITSKQTGS